MDRFYLSAPKNACEVTQHERRIGKSFKEAKAEY